MNESEFPALYIAADAASNRLQRQFLFAFGVNLWCLTISALLSVLNFENQIFAVAQSVLLLAGLASSVYLATSKTQQLWYGNRALAESIKTLSWRFMMRAEPYDIADTEARTHFLRSMRKILDSNKSASSHALPVPGTSEITSKMVSVRAASIKERSEFYLTDRIDDQLDWYSRKSTFNRKRAIGWFVLVFIAYAVAIIFSVLRVKAFNAPYWPTDFLTALASGFLAWIQTKRFQELSASYALTSHEIGIIKSEIPTTGIENDFSIFVSDAENAFSREHTQWQARRDRD